MPRGGRAGVGTDGGDSRHSGATVAVPTRPARRALAKGPGPRRQVKQKSDVPTPVNGDTGGSGEGLKSDATRGPATVERGGPTATKHGARAGRAAGGGGGGGGTAVRRGHTSAGSDTDEAQRYRGSPRHAPPLHGGAAGGTRRTSGNRAVELRGTAADAQPAFDEFAQTSLGFSVMAPARSTTDDGDGVVPAQLDRLPGGSHSSTRRMQATPSAVGTFTVKPPPARDVASGTLLGSTSLRSETRLRSSTRRLLEPKVMVDHAAHKRERGATPRKMAVERKRRRFQEQRARMADTLRTEGVDYAVIEPVVVEADETTAVEKEPPVAHDAGDGGDDAPNVAGVQAEGDQQDDSGDIDKGEVAVDVPRFITKLPLEVFDDESFDIHTCEEWAELIDVIQQSDDDEARLENRDRDIRGLATARTIDEDDIALELNLEASEERVDDLPPSLHAVALRYPDGAPRGAGTWTPCIVTAYDSDARRFVVQWLEDVATDDDTGISPMKRSPRSPTRKRVSLAKSSPAKVLRIDICFDKEDPEVFAKRVAAAVKHRSDAEASLRYHLAVDCMPTDDVGTPNAEQMRRVTSLCMGSSRLLRSSVDPAPLLREVTLDWQRTMNLLLFTRVHKERGSMGIFKGVELVGPPARPPPPRTGLVPSSAPSFAGLQHAFCFKTYLTQPAVVQLLLLLKQERDRVVDTNLLATTFTKSQTLSEFTLEQSKWTSHASAMLQKDWTASIATAVTQGLQHVGKGWYNLDEDDTAVFKFSKLCRLLTMIRLSMQDTLRILTTASLQSFTRFILDRSSARVAVKGPKDIVLSFPGTGALLALAGLQPSPGSVEAEAMERKARRHLSDAELAQRKARDERMRALLRPPPLFETNIGVTPHPVLLNAAEVARAVHSRSEWRARRKGARRESTSTVSSATTEQQRGPREPHPLLKPFWPTAGRESSFRSLPISGGGEAGDAKPAAASVDPPPLPTLYELYPSSDESDDESESDEEDDPKPKRVIPKYGHAFVYETDPSDFVAAAVKAFDDAVRSVQDVREISSRVMTKMFTVATPALASVSLHETPIRQMRSAVQRAMSAACEPLEPYLRSFDSYLPLLNLDVDEELDNWSSKFGGDLNIEAVVAAVRNHQRLQEAVRDALPVRINLGMFSIRVGAVRELLYNRHNSMMNGLMQRTAHWAMQLTQTVRERTNEAKNHMRKRVRNIEELTDLRKYTEEVEEMLPELRQQMTKAVACKEALEEFWYRIDAGDMEAMWSSLRDTESLVMQLGSVQIALQSRQEEMYEEMVLQQGAFKDEIDRISREVFEFNNLADLSKLENMHRRVNVVDKKIAEAEKSAQLYNSREALLDQPLTEYSELKETRKQFEPFSLMWKTAFKWNELYTKWCETPLMQLDADEVATESENCRVAIGQCCRVFYRSQNEGCLKVAQTVRSETDKWAPNVPLIVGLLNKGMRKRHWETLSESTGMHMSAKMNGTVIELLDAGLDAHTKEVVRVSGIAAREYQLEESLDNMERVWNDHKLDVVPYKDTGTFVLRGIVDMVAMLDEHISLTQAMQFSSYKGPFEERIERWNKKLALVSDVLDEWILVQKTWLYLAPIFDSDDINKQLPTEGKRFATVDSNWRRTLAAARQAMDAMTFLASEKLLQKFRESVRFLNTVQKGLSDYLESKRAVFTRFYFLSDDDLLQILSQTKEVERVQNHLGKCFEGISAVEFAKKAAHGRHKDKSAVDTSKAGRRAAKRARFVVKAGSDGHRAVGKDGRALRGTEVNIVAMCSAQGERIPFDNPVHPGNKGVEYWMTEVEERMRDSVRSVTKESLGVYDGTKRSVWMQEWPGMTVLATSALKWTADIEAALRKDRRALTFAYEQQLASLEDMIQLVRGKLSPIARITVGSLTVIDVHQRDVTKRLLDQGVRNPGAFEWISQMRYYWREENIFVEMVTSVRPYGYEYLGNSFRLVITPLTDKCYMTCMGALQMTLGGAPEGPAGTGKTETVKDLAKALAKQCVVFNCSEGLDYLAMGKFFKGLASCGAWSCFDEFNRIEIEVLSVVAQQIVTLQTAARAGIASLIFEGSEIRLDWQFSVYITMNPGYAGRTELPGNLKALFRPVAMMVPDYALIGEIMLFAYGFSDARPLAQKMVSTFRLCSEQLSSQPHYDYGMRAVKSVITAAGNLRQEEAQEGVDEQVVLLRALKDVNVPKFLAEDLILFDGIISDLFPEVKPPPVDYGKLIPALRSAAVEDGLQPTKYFLSKCIQLQETTAVRHGMMLVGPTGGGKSCTLRTLAAALTTLREEIGPGPGRYQKVRTQFMNPKAVTMGQLYGEFDDTTREWRDGILASAIRTFATSSSRDWKWVVCDGPVDAHWIENMNTVLDDNKKLCLTSGQIIALTPEMRILFEVEDLSQASPATVSRCGMVYMEPSSLGLDPILQSWLRRIPAIVTMETHVTLLRLFDTYIGISLNFVRRHLKEPIPSTDANVVESLCRILDCEVGRFRDVDPDVTGPLDEVIDALQEVIEPLFISALVWSIGANLDEASRRRFDAFLRTQMLANGSEYPIPAEATVYDYVFDEKAREWKAWMEMFPAPEYKHVPGTLFTDIFIPTPESVRTTHMMDKLLKFDKHVLLTGPTGTAKTVNIMRFLTTGVDSAVIPLIFSFSARTTARQTQEFVDEKCEKRRRHVYGPPVGSKFMLFVDDLNMPAREKYLAQPPLELLRQWVTYGGWYDIKSLEMWQIVDTVMVSAMGIPGGGRNPISARLTRHFNVIAVGTLSDDATRLIFGTILEGFLAQGFSPDLRGLVPGIVDASLATFNTVCAKLRPTPAKSHYTFNLRDLAGVFQGLLMCDPSDVVNPRGLLRLWVHESCRVIGDRLVDDTDRTWFYQLLESSLSAYSVVPWSTVMEPERGSDSDAEAGAVAVSDDEGPSRTPAGILFGEFAGIAGPGAGKQVYTEIDDVVALVPIFEEFLGDYNLESRTPMRLVMFLDAVHHVARISRILRQPQGNALLLGMGGSGRQSLTRLAAFMAEYRLSQIELTKNYTMEDWRDDVKSCLMRCGLEERPTVFLIADTQIVHEAMLEDINGLLNSGDIPGLYTADEQDEIMDGCRFAVSSDGLPLTRLNLFNKYLSRVRQNLHLVVAMNPVAATFRDRLRMFPSLVNCCTINWFREWPAEALHWVALSEMGLNRDEESDEEDGGVAPLAHLTEATPDQLSALIHGFIELHTVAAKAADKYFATLRRRVYVTPTSFLELLRTYKSLSLEKSKQLAEKRGRLEAGLDKLAETNEQVVRMQANLVNLRPELEATQVQVDSMMKEIQQDKVHADATKEVVEKEEAEAQAMAEATRAIADDAQRDLDAVLPLLDHAVACLNKLKKADIDEVRSMTAPPMGVRLTMEAACILFDVKPVIRTSGMGEKTKDYWEAAKKNLLTEAKAFLNRMLLFDKDHISDRVIKAITPYIEMPEFQPSNVERSSKACHGVCMWVRAMYKYHEVTLAVEPKKAALAKAQSELDATLITLADAKSRLQSVMDRIAELEERYTAAVTRKQDLSNEIQLCIKRLDAAKKLISGLSGESVRWNQDVGKFRQAEQLLVGDALVVAGGMVYSGPFTAEFRSSILDDWKSGMKKLGVPFTKTASLIETLSDPLVIREWQLAGLPMDDVSSENGIIIEKGRRSPLCIDPQGQANKFIKSIGAKLEGGLEVAKPTDKHLLRTLENAVRFGRWVLLEGLDEVVDPGLASILEGATEGHSSVGGRGQFIRVGDSVVPYNPQFKFFMTTKLPNPHYPPEIGTKVSLLNFTITPQGLEAQMLADVIQRELPVLAERKAGLLVDNQRMRSELIAVEEKILFLLSNSKGNILDDSDLLDALERAREGAADIAEKMKESEVTEKEIDKSREDFRPIAIRASLLFFAIAELAMVDPMYQFSLGWFKELFGVAVMNTPPSEVIEDRVAALCDTFTYVLFKTVCRGLFEKDKLLFAFLLAVKIAQSEGAVDPAQWRFLLSGATGNSLPAESNPNPEGPNGGVRISKRAWAELLALGTLPEFDGLVGNVTREFPRWGHWLDAAEPESMPLPGKWDKKLIGMSRLCLLRALRPDRVVFALRSFIVEEMDERYINPPAFNLMESYESSSNTSPLVFVLSPGADPLSELQTFASSMGMTRNLKSISLGQGQGANAEQLVSDGIARGKWVLLMNCHLFTSWMPTLEALVEELDGDSAHRDFRLWLTSEPSAAFPVPVLQASVKMTQERPKGLRSNLLSSYQRLKLEDLEMEDQSREAMFNKLLYALCFFHASITQRRSFGSLGWNIQYEFTDGDLDISRMQLKYFLSNYEKVPYRVLHELTANINYGGRITDDKDLRTIDVLLKAFFNAGVLSDDYSFSPSGKYKSLPVDHERPLEAYLTEIQKLPDVAAPEVFGMHSNAAITVAMEETYALLDVVLSLQPRVSTAETEQKDTDDEEPSKPAGKSRDAVIAETAASIVADLPQPYSERDVRAKYELRYEESMNMVLVQEVVRYNRLLREMHSTLRDVGLALEGLVVMSAELEQMADALFNQWVPELWSAKAYPSLKPLMSWVAELHQRLAMLDHWIENGTPATFWISGFYFPQAFLTGTLQNFARKYSLPIDTISFDTKVRDDIDEANYLTTTAPEDGCLVHGLFLEGATWSKESQTLAEPVPKVLFSRLPLIHLLPVQNREPPTKGIYRCPVYKTLSRHGVLSTTGHSTNFVAWIELPAGRPTSTRLPLVSETGVGDRVADCDDWVRAGVACVCSLRY